MSGIFDDLDDGLDALLSAPAKHQSPQQATHALARLNLAQDSLVPIAPVYQERCPKCRGTGRFVSYSGRVLGECFHCKGKGTLAFKTSAATRASNREKAMERKARSKQEALDAFAQEHPRVWAWMAENINLRDHGLPCFEFAANMHDALAKYESLTERQMAACYSCVDKRDAAIARRQEAAAERIAAAPAIDMTRIEAAFGKALQEGDDPKLRIGGLLIYPAKATSSNVGALYVKERGTYLGKIIGGKFIKSRECSEEQESRLLKIAADPSAAARLSGVETGICACCGRTLTDSESVARGIGPICAEKWGF